MVIGTRIFRVQQHLVRPQLTQHLSSGILVSSSARTGAEARGFHRKSGCCRYCFVATASVRPAYLTLALSEVGTPASPPKSKIPDNPQPRSIYCGLSVFNQRTHPSNNSPFQIVCMRITGDGSRYCRQLAKSVATFFFSSAVFAIAARFFLFFRHATAAGFDDDIG